MVIDDNSTQCTADTDCEQFGAHPTCEAGVCVASGLGPSGCFFGEPTTTDQFATRCTTSQWFQFNNCALDMCDDAALQAAYQKTITPAPLGTVPPPLVTEPMPTINCADVSPNIIYITGSTNLPPLLQAVQPLLYKGTPAYTAVFAPQTSCKGAASVYDPSASKHLITNTVNNWAFYYNASGVQTFCLLDAAGNTVDVGESDVYPSSCGYSPTTGIADYTGPIQAIAFVVPAGSSQRAISAEAAHLVFAAGGDGGRAVPWIDPHYYFVRSSGTGTTQLPSRAINVDPTTWWGLDRLSAGNLVDSMKAIDPSVAERAIGLLSSDFADDNRDNLRELAFQQRGQRFAYLPDSTPVSTDKANVRDGHYPIWGAIHFLAATDNGVPSAAARALVNQFIVPKLDENLVSAIIGAGFVPPCAMKVTHSMEVGTLTAFQPPFGCSCFYENQVNHTTACHACTSPADCTSAAPACNYGFCEKQ